MAPCDMASWMKPVLDVLTELLLGKILAKLRPPYMSDGQDTLSSQEKKKKDPSRIWDIFQKF